MKFFYIETYGHGQPPSDDFDSDMFAVIKDDHDYYHVYAVTDGHTAQDVADDFAMMEGARAVLVDGVFELQWSVH